MENLVVSTRKKINMETFFTSVKISTESVISKVLSHSTRIGIAGVESVNGGISITGRVFVDLVYLTAAGEIEHAEGCQDFIEKQKTEIALTDAFAEDVLKVENLDFSGNEVLCSVSHQVGVVGVYAYNIQTVSGDEKEFILNNKEVEFDKVVVVASDDFVVAEESEISGTNIKVLQNNVSVILDDFACVVDKVVLEGKVQLEILILNENEISTVKKSIEFKQEISASGVLPNMRVNALVETKTVNVVPEEKDGKSKLACTFEIQAKAYVFEKNTYEIVTDMFSLKNEIQTVYNYVEAKEYENVKTLSNLVTVQTDIVDIVDFEDIVDVFGAKMSNLTVKKEDGSFFVSGDLSAHGIYKTVDGYGDVLIENHVDFEIGESEFLVGEASAVCEVLSFKVKAGKEIETSVKIDYFLLEEREITEKFLSSYEIKDEKNENMSGIRVYVSKGNQSVFDVAKILNVKPEVIAQENSVDDVFEKGQKIYVYSQANLF